MKHYANILLAVLLTASLTTAHATNQADYTFTIHVGAFVNAKLTDFENIRPYGYIYAQQFNSLRQVYMGDYPTENDASKTLQQIKANGYPDAFITRRSLSAGEATTIIQLGTEKAGADINWGTYANLGPLHTYQDGKMIRIVTGPFENLDAAQNQLNLVKANGFKDAFVKSINSVMLHKVTDFETGGLVKIPESHSIVVSPPAIEPELTEEVIVAEIPPKKSRPNVMFKKKSPKEKKKSPKEEARPKSYGDVLTAKSPAAPNKVTSSAPTPKPAVVDKKKEVEKTLAMPYIRPKVKRTSVLKLQEVLKLQGTYRNSLDGFYGAGTKKSFQEMMNKHPEIQKYKLLSQIYETDAEKLSTIQEIIYGMETDIAVGVSRLQSQKRSVLSKVYQAYGIFALSGKNKKTDALMNEALKMSFAGKKLKNKPPFDYNAGYSYSDYKQLIRHMRYIHGASDEDILVPCWLFEKHNKEAMAAFDPMNDQATEDYQLQDCGNIRKWESLRLMETVMKEMTPDLSDIKSTNLAQLQTKRAALLLNPEAPSLENYKKIDQWNTNLWSGLAKWEAKDPLYAKMITPLKVSYFKSWALLEDHFMNKGLKAKEARGLSLYVLQTIVDPYLARYSD